MITLKSIVKILLSIIFVAQASCGGSSSSGNSSSLPDGNNSNPAPTVYDSISVYDPVVYEEPYDYFGRGESGESVTSSITGMTYAYHVYLPPEYDLEPERKFPVMYVTDAQYDKSFLAKVLDNESRAVIMIGIEEGPVGRRAVDYIHPGVEDYFRFFTEEFIPAIENQYRILPEDRSFEGSSAGGQASLAMLFLDTEQPPIFKRHLAFDPYITPGLRALIDRRVASGDPVNKVLFVSAAYGARGLGSTVTPFVSKLREMQIDGLVIHDRTYDVKHEEATWASYSTALPLIYENYDEQ